MVLFGGDLAHNDLDLWSNIVRLGADLRRRRHNFINRIRQELILRDDQLTGTVLRTVPDNATGSGRDLSRSAVRWVRRGRCTQIDV